MKEDFGQEDDKIIKMTELKRVKQGKKMIEGFVQKFRRIARESRYEKRLLIEEFKREMNGTIMRKQNILSEVLNSGIKE